MSDDVPSGRRLLVFAATFLGLLTLSQFNFARPVPLLSPPIVAAIVILAAAAGLMVWINTAWTRVLLWWAAGLSILAGGMSALLFAPPTWLALILIICSIAGLVGSALATVPKWRPTEMARPGMWMAIFAGLILGVIAAPAGGGPALALVTAGALLVLIWLMRPEAHE